MPRLDSSKGRCRCRSELSVMAVRARTVRANPPETKARARARDKNKHKSNDGDKAKGRDYWNSGQQQAQFQGYCSHCSKWGHKRADCRTRLAQQKSGAVAGVQEPESEADGVQAAQWSDADSDGADLDSSSRCFAASNNPRGPAGTLLVDSGADDHICHPRDVQRGNPLSHHGTRHVNLSVGTGGQRANIDFQIADISDNIISLGKLLRNGFVFNLRGRLIQSCIISVTRQRLFRCSCTRIA